MPSLSNRRQRSASPLNRPCTPPSLPNQRKEQQHWPTPTRVAIQEIARFNEAHGIPFYKNDLFRYYDVSKQTGYRILHESASVCRYHNDSKQKETQRRKSLIDANSMREMERLLQEEGIEARALTWAQLGYEVGLDCSWRTIQRAMGSMDYRKCIACRKGWQSAKSARYREQWAQNMLQRYPKPEDWYRVRFSDEVHYGYGAQEPLHIIRKPGERYCPDCIQRTEDPKKSEKKKIHAWAAIGYNFKSNIMFYDISSNTNGKMTLQDYRDQILDPIIKLWIQRGDDFALEEDGDSGHGTGKNNIVRKWKEENQLEYYFNCANSPDLSPIENT